MKSNIKRSSLYSISFPFANFVVFIAYFCFKYFTQKMQIYNKGSIQMQIKVYTKNKYIAFNQFNIILLCFHGLYLILYCKELIL